MVLAAHSVLASRGRDVRDSGQSRCCTFTSRTSANEPQKKMNSRAERFGRGPATNVSDERRAGQALGVRSKGLLRNEPDRSSIVLEVVGLKGHGQDVRIAGHELRRARCDLEALCDACDAVPTQAHECARSRPPRCASGQLTSREHANESLQRLDDRDPKSPCLKGSFP